MKYIGKIVVIFVLLVCFQITAVYGVNENIVIDKRVLDDKHVEVIISVDEKAQIAGGSFVFVYNSEKLTIDNILYNTDQNMYIVANKDYKKESNKIKITFASANVVKGRIAVIIFSNKEDNIDENDVIVQHCKVSNENGEVKTDINEMTVASKITKGDSIIDKNMDDIDKLTDKVENNEQKKESKKIENHNDNMFIFMILPLIMIIIGLVIFKKKRK